MAGSHVPLLPTLQVFQVMYKKKKQVYAMKVMRKDRILQKEHGEYVKAERDVLMSVSHPYIVTLRFSFQVRGCRPMFFL